MPESITVTDNRTGESVEIPLEDGGVNSAAWAKLMLQLSLELLLVRK